MKQKTKQWNKKKKKKKTANQQNPNPKSDISLNPYHEFIQHRIKDRERDFHKTNPVQRLVYFRSKVNASDSSNPNSDISISSTPIQQSLGFLQFQSSMQRSRSRNKKTRSVINENQKGHYGHLVRSVYVCVRMYACRLTRGICVTECSIIYKGLEHLQQRL